MAYLTTAQINGVGGLPGVENLNPAPGLGGSVAGFTDIIGSIGNILGNLGGKSQPTNTAEVAVMQQMAAQQAQQSSQMQYIMLGLGALGIGALVLYSRRGR